VKWKLVFAVIIVAILSLWFIPNTYSYTIEVESPQKSEVISRSTTTVKVAKIKTYPTSTKHIEQMITEVAVRYQIDEKKFLETARCESSLRPKVVGDHGQSVGLFQIHLPSHPDVTVALASDPAWAIEWSAKKFKVNPTIWTCYRNLYL
jgi:hypothetical protein